MDQVFIISEGEGEIVLRVKDIFCGPDQVFLFLYLLMGSNGFFLICCFNRFKGIRTDESSFNDRDWWGRGAEA